jgi:predicted Zn-dependent peptidase
MNAVKTIAVTLLAGLLACSGSSSNQYDPTIPPAKDGTRSITETTNPPPDKQKVPPAPQQPDPDPQNLDFPTGEKFRAEQPKAGEPRPFQLPVVNRFKLDNGITAYLIESHDLPTISVDLNFDGGQVTDPKGKEGLASVCMDMMSEGTERLEKIEYKEALADTASSIGSYAGGESHGVSMRTLTKHLDATHALFVETLMTPGMRDNDFKRMITRRLESLKQAKGSPRSVSGRVADSILYGKKHQFGRITTETSYGALSVDDCKAYHKKWLKPRGAKLFVVGDMTATQVNDRFGKIEGWKGKAKKAVKLPKPKPRKGRIFFVHIPGAAQSSVRMMHFGPKRKAKGYFANDLMSQVLGGSFASRLNMNLREDKGYSYGARGGLVYSRDFGEFYASSSVRSDSTYQTILEMHTEMKAMAKGSAKVTDEELTRVKNGVILGLPGSFATSRQALGNYRNLVYYGLRLDYYNTFVDKVSAVTRKQVNKAAKKHLKPKEVIILVVGDADAPMIHRVGDKDEPLMKDGKQVTLREALEDLSKEKKLGKGGLVILDADGKRLEK